MRGVYSTCLVLLSTMEKINGPIEQDDKDVHQFLDYMETYPNEVVSFHASGMVLRANTDA